MIEKKLTLSKLKQQWVKTYTNMRVKEVKGNQVVFQGEQEITEEGIDKIVVATGMKSYNPLEEELKGNMFVWVIGDARKARKAQDVIREGYQVEGSLLVPTS